jgi:WD40 repeat protein
MPDAQESSAPSKTASLMISYSRKDKVFVKQLYDSLVAKGFAPEDIWVDWEGIPLSADWMAEITKGIQSSNAFIFVISPDSVASEVCAKELEIAANSNKRFIPILYREPEKGSNLHPKISSHNWVFIRDEQELEKMLPALVEAINTDLDWLAQHTRLFNRAKEWESQNRNDSYLVRGKDLQDAEAFISLGAAGKEPPPTPLHAEYVQAAQKFAATTRRRNRIIAAVVGVALFALAVVASIQAVRATNNEQDAIANLNIANTEQVRADNNAATAAANEKIAIENEAVANQNARAANALALSSEAINQKNSDTQLSLMLSLLSIQETSVDNYVLPESQSALFASLNTPNVLYTWENGRIVSAVAYDPNGNYLALGNEDGLVQVVDTKSRDVLYTTQFDDAVSGLDFSPDGEVLGISSDDGNAKVVTAASGDELFSLAGHDGYSIFGIKFSPDGTMIATGGGDWNVKIWNASNGSIKVTLPSHTSTVTSVDFSPDSTRLVSGSEDDTVILWDLETNSLLNKFRPDGFDTVGNQITSVAFNPWGDRIIAGGLYGNVVVWDAFDYTELQRLRGNRAKVYAVDYAPDGLSMLTASSGLKIWDYYVGTERYNLSSHRGEVTAATYSQDGNYILTGSWDGTAKLWAANLLIDTLKIKYNICENMDANYSPDGQFIVVSDACGKVVIYNAQTSEVVSEWSTDVWAHQATFDPQNSQRIVASDLNGNVIVWDVGQEDPVFSIQAHDAEINSTQYSPDGSMILSAGNDGIVRLWDAQNGNLLREITREGGVRVAKFSRDGNQIAAADWDKTAYIFDASSGEQLFELKGHKDQILAFAFSHDGQYVYTASYDSTIRKWDLNTGAELLVMTGHTGRISDLDISPDDKLLASASADTTVKVWDSETGKELYNYVGNNEDSNSVAFSADGKSILTASTDETTKEFTIDYDTLLNIAQEYELRPLTLEECQRFLYRNDCTLTLFGGTPLVNATPSTPADQPTPTPAAEQPIQATSTPAVEQSVRPTVTPTVVPTTTAVSSSSSGSFYTEEFDNNLDSWDGFMVSGIDNQVNAGVDGGSFYVQLSPDSEKVPRFYLVNPAFDYSSVQMELTTTNYGNNANGVSLVCNYDGTNWYEFTISNAGLYSINAYDPTATALQGYIQLAGGGSGAIKSGQAINVYRAICNGSELTLYINDTLVKTLVDTKYNLTSGMIGLGVSSPQTLPVEVSFESLAVSEP